MHMRALLKSTGRRLSTGWLWPFVLLALPYCALDTRGLPGGGGGDGSSPPPAPAFEPGSNPHDAIMCDIRVPPPLDDCATAQDMNLYSMSRAAVMLVEGQNASVLLDFSPSVTSQCPNNSPKKVAFWAPFPDGLTLCINCASQIPAVYPDNNAACVAKCTDLINSIPPNLLPASLDGQPSFCNDNAHVSTNFKDPCFPNACNNPNFIDPRKSQELIKWASFVDTSALGTDLTSLKKDTPTAPGKPYDAGAASDPGQLITTGDGWVEFEANENTKGHTIGLSTGLADTDPSLNDIDFAVVLEGDLNLYIYANGIKLNGGGPNQSFRQNYQPGTRYRVHVTDNNDIPHTGTISVTEVTTKPCPDGQKCLEGTIFNQDANDQHPSYPFRVDASFNEGDAQLTNVKLVRIR